MKLLAIFQLRIELLDIEPLTWRCLQVPGDYTLWDLHVAIQGAFDWNVQPLARVSPVRSPGGWFAVRDPDRGVRERDADASVLGSIAWQPAFPANPRLEVRVRLR